MEGIRKEGKLLGWDVGREGEIRRKEGWGKKQKEEIAYTTSILPRWGIDTPINCNVSVAARVGTCRWRRLPSTSKQTETNRK